MADNKKAHVFIEGRVQGVGFRHFTRKTATSIGVNGWVRNLNDGRVEAVFEGSEQQVEKLIEACKKGPPISNVTDIEVDWQPGEDEFEQFKVVR
jgi:acylphosphatase